MAIKTIYERLNALTVEQVNKFHNGGLDHSKNIFTFFDVPTSNDANGFVNHPVEVFDALAATWLPIVRKYVVNNPHTPMTVLQYMVDRVTETDDRGLTKNEVASIVKHPNVTLGMIEQLWTKKFNHHAVVANLPATAPTTMFEKFYNESNASITVGFASNPNTPTFLLNKIDYNKFKGQLASNPNVSPDVLAKIWAKSKTIEITLSLLGNPSTPTKTLVGVWNRLVEEGNVFNPSHILTRIVENTYCHPVIVSKAKMMNHNKGTSRFGDKVIQISSEDYVNVLKLHYPEVTSGMPIDWLKGLLETVEENFYLVTVKELG